MLPRRDTSNTELMKNRKILYVSSEVIPYLPESEISLMSFEIPKMVNKEGGQIEYLCQDMVILTKGGINYMR